MKMPAKKRRLKENPDWNINKLRLLIFKFL